MLTMPLPENMGLRAPSDENLPADEVRNSNVRCGHDSVSRLVAAMPSIAGLR